MQRTRKLALLVSIAAPLVACSANTADTGTTGPLGGQSQVEGYGPEEAVACDDASFPMTMQAEDATLIGVSPATEFAGFEGSSYVGDFDKIGDEVRFEFCVAETDYYTFELRYANGTDESAFRTLYVDDELVPGDHRFRARWNWSDWEPRVPTADFKDSVLLEAGRHTLTVSFEPVDTGIMALDAMTVTRGPEPSSTSITGMLMNDWQELVGGVFASRVFPADDTNSSPRIGELRHRSNWEVNNIDEAAGYLRDVTGEQAYTEFDRKPMHTHIVMRDDGVLEMSYLNWGDNPLPATVVKEHAMPLESGVLVTRYTLTNVTDEARELSMLERVDLSRTGRQESADLVLGTQDDVDIQGQMNVEWREDLQAFIADLSALHGTYVVFGTFQEADQLSTGPSTGGMINPSSGASSGASSGGSSAGEQVEVASVVSQFGDGEALVRNESFTGDDAEMGIVETLTLEPGESQSFSYFYAVRGDLASAEAAARTARSESADTWIDRTSAAWSEWLAQRQEIPTQDPALDQAYRTALVSIKQTQQPEFGSFVAATNPAYQFKVWPRDASVVAMGLDAANYLDEAEAYWRWMASVQETGENEDFPVGTWWTNYSYWLPDEGIPFVQPEWDSLGLFTIGVYRHYLLLRERRSEEEAYAFFQDMWPAVQRASNFIADNIEENGFGPPDFSIWEDRFQYAIFTQVTYASGLVASYELARTAGEMGEEIESWLMAARSIKEAILRPYSEEECTGFWLPEEGFFMRGIDPDCSADRRVDASSDLMWVFGLIDITEEPKAQMHRNEVLEVLSPTAYFQGISRYQDDAFYFTSIYSPGGTFESTVPETTWPQMSMYMSMAEHWLGYEELSDARLDWYVSTSAVGYMPPGEGIDWATQQPLVSTAVEPVTGTWYLLGLMVNNEQYEPRLDRIGIDSGL